MPRIKAVKVVVGKKTFEIPEKKANELLRVLEGMFDQELKVDISEIFPDMKDRSPGNILRICREAKELTQAQLADELEINQHHVSEMETNKRPIGKGMAQRLAKALDTDYKMFL